MRIYSHLTAHDFKVCAVSFGLPGFDISVFNQSLFQIGLLAS